MIRIDDVELRPNYIPRVMVADSMNQLLDHAQRFDQKTVSDRFDSDLDEWVGRPIRNYIELKNAVCSPWEEGLNVIDQMTQEIMKSSLIDRPKSRRRRQQWSEDSGDDICLDRLRGGQQFWRRTNRQVVTSTQTITIMAELSASAAVDANQILWRGATMIAVAKILEEAGYRCELWGFDHFHPLFCSVPKEQSDAIIAWKLKRSSDRLDVGTVASGISSWFYRLAVFAACYGFDREIYSHLGSGGTRPDWCYPVSHITRSDAVHLIREVWEKEQAVEVAREIIKVASNPSTNRHFNVETKENVVFSHSGKSLVKKTAHRS